MLFDMAMLVQLRTGEETDEDRFESPDDGSSSYAVDVWLKIWAWESLWCGRQNPITFGLDLCLRQGALFDDLRKKFSLRRSSDHC